METNKQSNTLNYNVKVYTETEYQAWNSFVANAKNATFLFHRDFMEYHKDRFMDYSLMIYQKGVLMALLPGNKCDDVLHTHQGLTYGGLILNFKATLPAVEEIQEYLIAFFKDNGINRFVLKAFPNIYASHPSDELVYLLNRKNATIVKHNIILAIDYKSDFKIHKSKLKRFRKFEKTSLQIKSGIEEVTLFWNQLLEPRLLEKHNTRPVHNLEEIKRLALAFPKHIVQYTIYQGNELLAGITIFKTKIAIKSQYGIASKHGERIGALDMLFVSLIKSFQKEGYRYFSMGRINDDSQQNGYNPGMLKQKQEYGCQIYLQPVYQLDLHD